MLLQEILENKRSELPALRQKRWSTAFAPRTFTLERSHCVSLITEIKFRSPSAGPLSSVLSAAERAVAYQRGGASMISVLCDGRFFDGAYEHLAQARQACDLPLLCKEFVLDECQLDAAVANGADAVLLIARCLSPERLDQLTTAALDRGLAPLVEVHDSRECRSALETGAQLIGVNARNLDTLQMLPQQAQQILASLPRSVTRIHLSGVKTPADLNSLKARRVDAALIGEVLMREDDPEPLLRLLAEASSA